MLSANKINKYTLQIIFKSKKSFYLSFNDESALAEYKFGFTQITQLEFQTLKVLADKENSNEIPTEVQQTQIVVKTHNIILLRRKVG